MTDKKVIKKRLQKVCSICGKAIKVIIYSTRAYRGGHFFGKIPLHTKAELRKVMKLGTHSVKIGNHTFAVLNKDPKPYDWAEYWECPQCYWRG